MKISHNNLRLFKTAAKISLRIFLILHETSNTIAASHTCRSYIGFKRAKTLQKAPVGGHGYFRSYAVVLVFPYLGKSIKNWPTDRKFRKSEEKMCSCCKTSIFKPEPQKRPKMMFCCIRTNVAKNTSSRNRPCTKMMFYCMYTKVTTTFQARTKMMFCCIRTKTTTSSRLKWCFVAWNQTYPKMNTFKAREKCTFRLKSRFSLRTWKPAFPIHFPQLNLHLWSLAVWSLNTGKPSDLDFKMICEPLLEK